jgi:transcription antitermination factor NusG
MDRDFDSPAVDVLTEVSHDKAGGNVSLESKAEPSWQKNEQLFEEGQQVQIRSGALQGVRGTILRRSVDGRVLLRVDFFGDGVCLQVMENLIEPTP